MVYLESFHMLTRDEEEDFLSSAHIPREIKSRYPFNIFRYRELETFTFEPITVFYGTNGSGKSTILNVMASALRLRHQTPFNRGSFFDEYVRLCKYKLAQKCYGNVPRRSKIITSDDVFDRLINVRNINADIDRQRNELEREHSEISWQQMFGFDYQIQSLDDYDTLMKYADNSHGRFMERAEPNIKENSNGENAFRLFESMIEENALYLLDEPENSLSAEKQLDIRNFVSDSARFYGCQFVISTHSPFFLSIPHAKIYNIDETPPCVCKWTDLPNIRAYWELFRQNASQFD